MTQINVGHLFMDTVYADIVFVVDKEEIPGHRVILATICAYFDKLLFGDFLESKSKKVDISGISAKVFKEVMRFVYKEQLEVEEWTIEDLMSLLSVAHEYQFQPLFSAVIKAMEDKPLKFDSWQLVKSASSIYDCKELGRKCAAFAEQKIDDFICERDLEKYSANLICCMLDAPKMSGFNQDHVVKAICNWRMGQNDSDIMSVIGKINWETVSPKFTAIVLKDLFSTVKNVGKQNFWTKLSANIDGPFGNHALNDCILRVGSVVLKKHVKMKFALPNIDSNFFCCLVFNQLEFWFQKDATEVELPVKRIEFETSTKFNIGGIGGWSLKGAKSGKIVFQRISSNGWFKYNVVVSDSEPLNRILIYSRNSKNIHEISLRNFIIH